MRKPIKQTQPPVLSSPTPHAPSYPRIPKSGHTNRGSRLGWALISMSISKAEADKTIGELREHGGWAKLLNPATGAPYESLDAMLFGEFGITSVSWASLTYLNIK